MAYRNQQAQEMVSRWVEWLKTRNRYTPSQKDSVLATMMAGPKKRRPIPVDWDNDPDAAFFHLAVMSLPANKRIAFLKVYGQFPELSKPVKYWCHEMGEISRPTFYQWAHEAADQAVIRAKRMKQYDMAFSLAGQVIKHAQNPQNECKETLDNLILTFTREFSRI